jgi:hypothetical protein
MMEMKIESAAVRYLGLGLGVKVLRALPPPNTHSQIIAHFKLSDSYLPEKMGFITSTGEFVGRKKAWKIACEANQILPTPAKNPGKLHTSDIDWNK